MDNFRNSAKTKESNEYTVPLQSIDYLQNRIEHNDTVRITPSTTDFVSKNRQNL
jgi:hypothetical protein